MLPPTFHLPNNTACGVNMSQSIKGLDIRTGHLKCLYHDSRIFDVSEGRFLSYRDLHLGHESKIPGETLQY